MNLINGATLNDTITIEKQAATLITLATQNTYLDKQIQLTLNVQSASPSFDGGALNNKTATISLTNATSSASNTSGIMIQAIGSAGRDAVLYDGAVDGWVGANDNTTALAALAADSWNGTSYYLTGVTLTNGKTFNITVPNGNNETITFRFTVDSNGNTTIDSP